MPSHVTLRPASRAENRITRMAEAVRRGFRCCGVAGHAVRGTGLVEQMLPIGDEAEQVRLLPTPFRHVKRCG